MGLEDIQLPPNDYELEKLGLSMLSDDFSKIDLLDEDCFYWDINKKIFKAFKKIKSADFVPVALEVGISPEEVLEIISSFSSSATHGYIISQLNKYKNARLLLRGVHKLELQARGLEIEKTRETLDKLGRVVQDIQEEKTIEQHGLEYFEDIGVDKKEIKTGYKTLDKHLSLYGGQLVVIAGRPSMGKTTVMQNIALRQSNSWKVGFISMEMQVFELLDRFVCMIGGMTSWDIKSKRENKDKITEDLGSLMEKKLSITENIYTLSKIEQYIIKNELDVCYIDYLGLIQYGSEKMMIIQRISEITRQLKLMAKKNNCLIMLGCQLSREVEKRADKRPILADLRDSGTIEQDADIVVMLYRDEYYDEGTDQKNKIELLIRKQRNGEQKSIELDSKFSSYRILDQGIAKRPF